MTKAVLMSICLCSLLVTSCRNSLKKEDYIRWVTDYSNGLHVHTKAGEFEFDVQYLPSSYRLLQQGDISRESFDERSDREQDGLQYLLLTVGISGGNVSFIDYGANSHTEKQERLYYFSYRFQEDIRLEEGDKLLPCVLYHFERPVDLLGSRNFLLGFERPKTETENVRLVIDSERFGSLPVRIKLSKAKIPTLVL